VSKGFVLLTFLSGMAIGALGIHYWYSCPRSSGITVAQAKTDWASE
jgi:hypothetical protein